MIADSIKDVMTEVREVTESLDDGSAEWMLMQQVHSLLGVSHSLVHEVNRLRLGQLVNGKKD